MIKIVLSWVVVIYMMFSSATRVTTLFMKTIWDENNTTPIEYFVAYLFATIAVVVSALTAMYVTGLWTP